MGTAPQMTSRVELYNGVRSSGAGLRASMAHVQWVSVSCTIWSFQTFSPFGSFYRSKYRLGIGRVGSKFISPPRDPEQLGSAGFFDQVGQSPPNLMSRRLTCRVNDSDMIFSVATLVSFLSQSTTLPAGTAILTGTPTGVGFSASPQRFLQPGDEFAVEIAPYIGSLVTVFQDET